ncbi:MAG: type II toxin-antitoxin system VapC family toxin [Gammaproteobacteria bacterium]
MNVVDSSAWLAYLAGEPNAEHFASAIENTAQLLVPAITLSEVFKSLFRQRGEETALHAVGHMMEGKVVPLDATLAIDAASLGIEHSLPLADSIILATARKFDAVLWTQDADFEHLPKVNFLKKNNQ